MARVVMYSSYLCVYCWMAKVMLRRKGVEYEVRGGPVIMGWKPPVRNYKEMVERSGGQTTVPQIFVDGEYLGDEETMAALEKEGKLDAALKVASAA